MDSHTHAYIIITHSRLNNIKFTYFKILNSSNIVHCKDELNRFIYENASQTMQLAQ